MSYLEELRSRRKTPQAAWHKLISSLRTNKYNFYLVFEGEEDEEFFSRHVEKILEGAKFCPIICDGKGGVLALQQTMLSHFGDFKNVYFILDSDHDKFINLRNVHDQTFRTCGYSVENYLQSVDVCVSAIKRCYQLRDIDPLVPCIESRVTEDFKVFEKRASIIMAYVIALRVSDKNIDLDKIKFTNIFEYHDYGLKKKMIDCEKILKEFEIENGISLQNFSRIIKNLKIENPTTIIRGKLVSQFVMNLIRAIPNLFKDKSKINGKKLKSKIDIGSTNIMYFMFDFIETPPRLECFIRDIGASISSAADNGRDDN